MNNDAQAIVLECMAVQPQYQRDSEELLICATHGVITNIRPDHWEWTDTEEKILEGFKKTIPNNGILIYGKNYIAESLKPNWNPSQKSKLNLSLLEAASLKNTKLILAEPELSKNQIETAFGYIRYPEHYENVEIAVRVCETLGVSSKSILRGITNTVSDPGALKILEKEVKGKRQRFVFAFAANDVVSFEKILKSDQKKWSEFDSIILVFNSKQERPFRTIEFGKFLTDFSGLSKIYFFGSWQKLFRSVYEGNADLTFYKKNIIFNFKEIFSKSNLWIGAGNYQGFGRVWLEKLAADLNVIEGKGWKSLTLSIGVGVLFGFSFWEKNWTSTWRLGSSGLHCFFFIGSLVACGFGFEFCSYTFIFIGFLNFGFEFWSEKDRFHFSSFYSNFGVCSFYYRIIFRI